MVARPAAPPLPSIRPGAAWPEPGHWTYEDYLRLPDDGKRYEIIEGVLYVANAPAYDHQFAVGKLHQQLANFVGEHALGVVIPAPFEVHLPGIAKPVQPDVLFIAAERQPAPDTQIFEGAPDLIVEVLSPGSLRLDQHIKFGAYERAKVREYWLVDPKTRSVIVYTLPSDSVEYVLLGQFSRGENARSAVLAGFEIAVDSLFVA
ncbi:MAG: Uma2 family endonuclease [Chloroflexota bacterium]